MEGPGKLLGDLIDSRFGFVKSFYLGGCRS